MKSLLFEKYLLEKMRALAGSKLTGVFTHIPAGTPYPYGLLSVGEVKGMVGEPFVSIPFSVMLVTQYRGSQQTTELIDHLKQGLEMPSARLESYRLLEIKTQMVKDQLLKQTTMDWLVRLSQILVEG
ncbi:MAG: hypothetical protein ACK5TR_07135 [Alphaproteobacteria bacterium]|jgi:hypothetical protein|nr:hypothetical protein [Alphaproteobacteria bacterium]